MGVTIDVRLTETCWVKDNPVCGNCFGCFLDFVLHDPVCQNGSNRQSTTGNANRATGKRNRLKEVC